MRGDGFDAFCSSLAGRRLVDARLAPTALAREFVRQFKLSGFPRFERIRGLIESEGVGTVAPRSLPSALRGAHFGLQGGPYEVYYNEADWEPSWEHTLLHEAYEIIQEKRSALCRGYVPPRGKARERMADRFAAEVLMQPALFEAFLRTSGLDLVLAARSYGRSYASVALRAVEVLKDLPLLVAVYECREEGEPDGGMEPPGRERFVAATVAATAPSRSSEGRRPFGAHDHRGQVVPRRGDPPHEDSVTALAIEQGRPVYAERSDGQEPEDAMGVVALARPVRRQGRLARVVLVALPWRDRALLEPQVLNVSPVHVEGMLTLI